MFIIDDIIKAIGAKQAAKAQERNVGLAQDTQRGIWDQQRSDQQPWMNAGQTSLADLMQQMQSGAFNKQINPSDIANDPGYQFRMAQGQKALERSAAARGGLAGGGFMKGLDRYSQGLASDEYQNAWSRNQTDMTNRFGRLANIAGMGQNSAQNLGALGSHYADSMSNLFGARGNAQSAGIIGQANGYAGAIGSVYGNATTAASMMTGMPLPGGSGMQGGGQGGGGGGQYGAQYMLPQQQQQVPQQPQYTPGWGMPPYR